jgi:hypothetical protein
MLWVLAILLVLIQPADSFTLTTSQRSMSTKFESQTTFSAAKSKCRSYSPRSSSLQMKDASAAYWFTVGNKVQVTTSVKKAGIELKGRIGEVTATWEKCDVDPTCCCAEFVDDNFAVTVKFGGTLDPDDANGNDDEFIKGIGVDTTFTHYFNENELIKVNVVEDSPSPPPPAFDGMSCKAFKLDQLKMGKQAQRIAAFEASRSKEE